MKCKRKSVHSKERAFPQLRFEDQRLTSFAGLVVLQRFFLTIDFSTRLRKCLQHLSPKSIYPRHTLFLQLVLHVMLGFRELRDAAHYQDDPLLQRMLGLKRLPDVATISRMLKQTDELAVSQVRQLMQQMVLERIAELGLRRITLDFDGSVQSTKRRAEGTAVGFNKKKKGARSYYPLFCTIAQTGQVLNVLHRSGNVHDSNGAQAFILSCVQQVRSVVPGAIIEVRMDSAFFSDEIVTALHEQRVEFSISVPFERFPALKKQIEDRCRWRSLSEDVSYFETSWKPKSWSRRFRFLMIRTRTKQQQKGPVQLDLFEPYAYGYEFKVIVTNKTLGPLGVVRYHEGRGSQEGVFAELKSSCQMDYIPVRRRHGNELYLLASLMAFNLIRELQMTISARERGTTTQRMTLWGFEKVDTIRKTILQRAGRLTRPEGQLVLTFCKAKNLKDRVLQILDALGTAT